MLENKIEFFIYNNALLPRKRLELQFNFNVEVIKIYRGNPNAQIPCSIIGINSSTINFVFHSPINDTDKNIGVYVEGKSSGKPRLERLIWVTTDDLPGREIDRINRSYFP